MDKIDRVSAHQEVDYCVDNALAERRQDEIPKPDTNVRYVVWDDDIVVAVWSYLGGTIGDEEAISLAVDLLNEKYDSYPQPDYVL